LVVLLDAAGVFGAGQLFDRALPAARVTPAALAPLLSGAALPVAGVAGIRSVTSLLRNTVRSTTRRAGAS
jgi:hypothetical protein